MRPNIADWTLFLFTCRWKEGVTNWENCTKKRFIFVCLVSFCKSNMQSFGPSGRAVWDVDLQPLGCWDCGFESRRGHGCLSVVSVVCCYVERSLRQAGHSSRGVLPGKVCDIECDREASITRRPWTTRGCCAMTRRVRRKVYSSVFLLSITQLRHTGK